MNLRVIASMLSVLGLKVVSADTEVVCSDELHFMRRTLIKSLMEKEGMAFDLECAK